MELIQALEQLSLEVKSKGTSVATDYTTELVARQQGSDYGKLVCRDHPINWHYPTGGLTNQLEEFDSSIATLLVQISDLDWIVPNVSSASRHASSRRADYLHPKQIDHLTSGCNSGSMDTSQEEDSDCSSHQSGHISVSTTRSQLNPLVEDLLKRDLCAITDTVRKIGRILEIGVEIENYHNRLFEQQASSDHLDLSRVRSSCETFISLCESEPHIKDLPTIVRYNNYCHKMMTQLNKLNPNSTASIFELGTDGMDDDWELDDEAGLSPFTTHRNTNDADFLSCDQRCVNNWTENRLYVNNRSG